jgi:hypothetical protein
MIPTPWLLIPALSLLAYAGVMTFLYKEVVDDYANFRAELVSIQKQAESDAAARQLRSEKVTADVSLAWAAALAYSRRHPVVRVLPRPDCDSGKGTSVSVTGLKPTQETSQFGLGREVVIAVEECQQRLENAAVDAAQVITLIDWIRKTHEASK